MLSCLENYLLSNETYCTPFRLHEFFLGRIRTELTLGIYNVEHRPRNNYQIIGISLNFYQVNEYNNVFVSSLRRNTGFEFVSVLMDFNVIRFYKKSAVIMPILSVIKRFVLAVYLCLNLDVHLQFYNCQTISKSQINIFQ